MVTIGILALQGAVSEHEDMVKQIDGVSVKLLKLPADFQSDLDGIILPGGESTTMAIVGTDIFPLLKQWVVSNKPIWGTCAGMILLSNHAIKTANDQALVGGLDVHVCRNYFGSQVYSKKVDVNCNLNITGESTEVDDNTTAYPAVFIRAPAILKVGADVTVLGTVVEPPHRQAKEEVYRVMELDNNSSNNDEAIKVIIAVKQANILGTAFHPELTKDLRWHRLFVDMVRKHKQ